MSLKYRIALIIVLLQSLLMAIIFWHTTQLIEQHNEIQFNEHANSVLQLFGELGILAEFNDDYSELQSQTQELSQNPTIEEILILNHNNRIRVSHDFSLIGTKKQFPESDPTAVWRSQALSEHTLWIRFSRTALQKYTDQAWQNALWIAIIGLLIIALVALFIGIWLTRRLAHLSHSAELFAQGHYQSRSPLSGKDEVTTLSQAFNHMAELTEKNINALKNSNDELEHFAYIASHDLQTPLRSIRLLSDMLAADLGDRLDDDEKDYFKRIQKAAQRMSQLLQALLAYSRIKHTKNTLKPVNLTQQIRNIEQDLSASIQDTQARLEIDELPTVLTDEHKSHQLFLNLLSNALKYHRDGHPPHVRVRVSSQPHQHLITVSDNGIGFDMTYRKKIFQPFKRLHSQDQYDGTGIGLATCQKVLDALDWKILVNSKPQQGSQFTVMIPRVADHKPERSPAL